MSGATTTIHGVDCRCKEIGDIGDYSALVSYFKNNVRCNVQCTLHIAGKIIDLSHHVGTMRNTGNCCTTNMDRVVKLNDNNELPIHSYLRELLGRMCCFTVVYNYMYSIYYTTTDSECCSLVDTPPTTPSYFGVAYVHSSPEYKYSPVVDITSIHTEKDEKVFAYKSDELTTIKTITDITGLSVGELLHLLMNNYVNDQNKLAFKGPKYLYKETDNHNRIRTEVVTKIRDTVGDNRKMTITEMEPIWNIVREYHASPTQLLIAKYIVWAFSTVNNEREITLCRWRYDGSEESPYNKYHCISSRSAKKIHYITNGVIRLPICGNFLETLFPELLQFYSKMRDEESK